MARVAKKTNPAVNVVAELRKTFGDALKPYNDEMLTEGYAQFREGDMAEDPDAFVPFMADKYPNGDTVEGDEARAKEEEMRKQAEAERIAAAKVEADRIAAEEARKVKEKAEAAEAEVTVALDEAEQAYQKVAEGEAKIGPLWLVIGQVALKVHAFAKGDKVKMGEITKGHPVFASIHPVYISDAKWMAEYHDKETITRTVKGVEVTEPGPKKFDLTLKHPQAFRTDYRNALKKLQEEEAAANLANMAPEEKEAAEKEAAAEKEKKKPYSKHELAVLHRDWCLGCKIPKDQSVRDTLFNLMACLNAAEGRVSLFKQLSASMEELDQPVVETGGK